MAIEMLPTWYQRDDLPCKQIEVGVMYPEEGNMDEEAIAKSVCGGCDAIDVCLSWALKHRENFGVWGGRTASERLNIARKISKAHRTGR